MSKTVCRLSQQDQGLIASFLTDPIQPGCATHKDALDRPIPAPCACPQRDCNLNGVTPETEETPVTVVTMDAATGSVQGLDGVDEQLVRQLAERARAEGLKLTGEGGLLARLTKVVVESALEGEMDDCLGYAKGDPAGRNGGNSRNGTRPKTVLTEAGPVD